MSDNHAFALVFPGQGSQSVGMLRGLAAVYPVIGETFSEAGDILGFDMRALIEQGPEEELNRTAITQPALLAADIACYRAWRAAGGGVPASAAGHSLGEYAALVCAESLVFADALRLVARRGQLMQEAVPEGAGGMAAILGLTDEVVQEVCQEAAQGDVLAAVNFNAPGQVVIAGARAGVERAIQAAKGRGAKRALVLAVSVPSHCALMTPAAERFAQALAEVAIAPPKLPVWHNADVSVSADAAAIRSALTRQLSLPVRWVDTVKRLVQEGASSILECGPGKVLTGLNKRIASVPCLALGAPEDLTAALAAARP